MSDDQLRATWSLKQRDQILFTDARARVLRTWCLSHLIHHRGQLCVYLRLLGAPVPRIYFMSTDEPHWVLE